MNDESKNKISVKNTLILGLGNLLLKDEGVGIHCIKALEQKALPSDVDLMDGGTGGLHLISWIDEYRRIIMIDATLDDNPPGTVRVIHPRYASDFPPLMSAHEIGIRDMIDAMTVSDKMPEITLIVISVEDISEVGMELSPKVKAAVNEVVEMITNNIILWNKR
ncbi:MAG: hydrogenase maturation protease [Dysgonamonadaceae bacterium]|jgi:hydrogenase maturation protease|nr:hydrogenase maturation protease [Dysgonamonadaceae bacterium]